MLMDRYDLEYLTSPEDGLLMHVKGRRTAA